MDDANWFLGRMADSSFIDVVVLNNTVWTVGASSEHQTFNDSQAAHIQWTDRVATIRNNCDIVRLWRYDPARPHLAQLQVEIIAAVRNILDTVSPETMTRFALYSDSMAMTVCAAACFNDSRLDPEDLWCPQEWPYVDDSHLAIATRYLQSRILRPWPNSFDQGRWCALAHETMVAALAELAESWPYAPRPVLLFEPSAGEMDIKTIERLNGSDIAARYRAA